MWAHQWGRPRRVRNRRAKKGIPKDELIKENITLQSCALHSSSIYLTLQLLRWKRQILRANFNHEFQWDAWMIAYLFHLSKGVTRDDCCSFELSVSLWLTEECFCSWSNLDYTNEAMFSRTLDDGTLPHPSCCSTPKGKVTIAMVTPKFNIDSGNLKF